MALCVDREASSEERGTETNSLNALFGARFSVRVYSQAFAPATQFAGCSKTPAYRLALEPSPFDHSYA